MLGPTSASLTFTGRASSSLASLALSPGHPVQAQHLHLRHLLSSSCQRRHLWTRWRRCRRRRRSRYLPHVVHADTPIDAWHFPPAVPIFASFPHPPLLFTAGPWYLRSSWKPSLSQLCVTSPSHLAPARTHVHTHSCSLSLFLSPLVFSTAYHHLWILPQWDPSFYLFIRITFRNNKSPKCLCGSELEWEILIWSKLTLK